MLALVFLDVERKKAARAAFFAFLGVVSGELEYHQHPLRGLK
ncbi:hypothetical protein PULV_a2672 [Pseudoalteromonas ulvae UL12]|nr:hypothetical protein [Pseudoalteromonas ulvae UL12]